ncbi:MAG: chaperone modulator CbpM [Pseudomonadota bacterium]
MNVDERTVVLQVERLTLRELRLWVQEGWVRPAQAPGGPVFDEVDIARVRLLCDLKKDMSIPSDAVSVVLSLIDQLHQTRHDLRCLSEALDAQSEQVRRSVLKTYRKSQGTALNARRD